MNWRFTETPYNQNIEVGRPGAGVTPEEGPVPVYLARW